MLDLGELRDEAGAVAQDVLAKHAPAIDEEARWPAEGMRALGEAGLLGLNVGVEIGGRGEGMAGLAAVTEELGRACGSTALVFGMHCVATKVIAAQANQHQRDHYLAAIAAGEHVTSLALAEPGTGVHFYVPRTTFRREGSAFVLDGRKSFVTSGGHAHSYVVSVVADDGGMDPGTFSCLLLDADTPNLQWGDAWDGFGMRGNSSRSLQLDGTVVSERNLLGAEGDETWYLFEIIAPYFIVAMAGAYLGIARAALEETIGHVRERTYDHDGRQLGATDLIAHRLGSMWTAVERARRLLYHAASAGDEGAAGAREALFACKAEIAEVAVAVTNEAMTVAGGIAYGQRGTLGRALRDARASHVMAPSTDLLKTWLGRSLLDLPLL